MNNQEAERKSLETQILNEVLNCIAQKNPDAEKCTMYIMGILSSIKDPIPVDSDKIAKEAIIHTLKWVENHLSDDMSNGIFNDFKNTVK